MMASGGAVKEMKTVSFSTYVPLSIERYALPSVSLFDKGISKVSDLLESKEVLFGSCAETPGVRLRRVGLSNIINKIIAIMSFFRLMLIFVSHFPHLLTIIYHYVITFW